MRPMFSYFGSKYKLAKKYGPPRYDTVVEPFAGSAAYSLFWEPKHVVLVDKNPIITGIWEYLRTASEDEILALPEDFDHVNQLDIAQDAKNLIGFWLGKGKASPGLSRSSWGRQYKNSGDCKVWGMAVKKRIASQVHKIRHWDIFLGDYTILPNITAHWFIDPPYKEAGRKYKVNDVEYTELADWAQERKGFVQVCENKGAAWLPFKDFHSINTYHHIKDSGIRSEKYSHEVLYEQ